MRTSGRIGFSLISRAMAVFYTAANVIRTRSTSDRLVLGAIDQSASDSVLSVDSGAASSQAVVVRGIVRASTFLVDEVSANLTCNYLTHSGGTLDKLGIYVKNNQLVFAHQCGANGTLRYLTITLDGLSCAWVQSTTAP